MLDRRCWWWWALIALAIAARVAAVLFLRSHEVPRSTYEHGEIAANLLAGRGFSVHFLGKDGPTSQQAPVYPVLVAGAYALGGIDTPRALLILELGQAILGGVLVAGVLALAAEIETVARGPGRFRPPCGKDGGCHGFRPRNPCPGPSDTGSADGTRGTRRTKGVALAAGLIAALHPTLVYAATHVQVALLAATLLIWTLALAYRAGRTGRDRDAVTTGLVLALLVLTDPILGLVAPGAGWAIGRAQQKGRRALRLIGLMALAATLGVTPWIVRNARVHGEFVFIKSTFGYAFWQGNCALSAGTDKVMRPSVDRILDRPQGGLLDQNRLLWEARHEAGYLDDIALTAADYRVLATLSEPARSRLLFRRALADLRRAGPLSPALPATAALFPALRRDQPQDPQPDLSRRPSRPDASGRAGLADHAPGPASTTGTDPLDRGLDRRVPHPDDRLRAVPCPDRAGARPLGRYVFSVPRSDVSLFCVAAAVSAAPGQILSGAAETAAATWKSPENQPTETRNTYLGRLRRGGMKSID